MSNDPLISSPSGNSPRGVDGGGQPLGTGSSSSSSSSQNTPLSPQQLREQRLSRFGGGGGKVKSPSSMSPDKSKQLATPSTTTIKNVTDTKHTNNDVTSNNSKSIDTIIPSLKDPPPTPKDKTDSSDSSNITSIENVCMNGSTPLKEEAAAATNTADVNNVMRWRQWRIRMTKTTRTYRPLLLFP